MHTLEVIVVPGLLVHDADELGALDVLALGPVIPDIGLAVDKAVGAEDAAEGAGVDGLYVAQFHVHEHGMGT